MAYGHVMPHIPPVSTLVSGGWLRLYVRLDRLFKRRGLDELVGQRSGKGRMIYTTYTAWIILTPLET